MQNSVTVGNKSIGEEERPSNGSEGALFNPIRLKTNKPKQKKPATKESQMSAAININVSKEPSQPKPPTEPQVQAANDIRRALSAAVQMTDEQFEQLVRQSNDVLAKTAAGLRELERSPLPGVSHLRRFEQESKIGQTLSAAKDVHGYIAMGRDLAKLPSLFNEYVWQPLRVFFTT